MEPECDEEEKQKVPLVQRLKSGLQKPVSDLITAFSVMKQVSQHGTDVC